MPPLETPDGGVIVVDEGSCVGLLMMGKFCLSLGFMVGNVCGSKGGSGTGAWDGIGVCRGMIGIGAGGVMGTGFDGVFGDRVGVDIKNGYCCELGTNVGGSFLGILMLLTEGAAVAWLFGS